MIITKQLTVTDKLFYKTEYITSKEQWSFISLLLYGLHNNIPQHQTRKIIEALEISKKNTETIMNGCIGRVLT